MLRTLAILLALGSIGAAQAEELVPLKIELPKPLFVGTPRPIKVSNLEPEQAANAGPLMVPAATALLPVLGRALLGLAGAYLLRAFTESGTFAPQAGVAIGLLYALLWLVWAARTPAARRIETALRSLTSVLVLAPLLWEATLRFHAISTWTAGAILLLFTVFGLAVSWRKDLLIVATITTLAGLGTDVVEVDTVFVILGCPLAKMT